MIGAVMSVAPPLHHTSAARPLLHHTSAVVPLHHTSAAQLLQFQYPVLFLAQVDRKAEKKVAAQVAVAVSACQANLRRGGHVSGAAAPWHSGAAASIYVLAALPLRETSAVQPFSCML